MKRFPTICFNPRTREGATIGSPQGFIDICVSIHAPVRVRPAFRRTPGSCLSRFNPRTREGATGSPPCSFSGSGVSIHAPVRVRRFFIRGIIVIIRFNPRTREGATIENPLMKPTSISFNPRTREGATVVIDCGLQAPDVSIHAPVRVRLSPWATSSSTCGVSIHAPVRVRLERTIKVNVTDKFQSTHP